MIGKQHNRKPRPGAKWDMCFIVDRELVLHFDSVEVVDRMGDAILRHFRTRIRQERLPSTGKKVGVGFQTGLLSKEIVRQRIRGDKTRARANLVAPSNRHDWLRSQAEGPGNYWFDVGGDVKAVVDNVLFVYLRDLTAPKKGADRAPKRSKAV